MSKVTSICDLIETSWNVKKHVKIGIYHLCIGFNRNIVECKENIKTFYF